MWRAGDQVCWKGRDLAADIGCYERFRSQIRNMLKNLRCDDLPVGSDSLGGVHREVAMENSEASQDDLLRIRQQVIAPVHSRPQGLMARQRGPAAPREEPETVVEPGCKFLYP
jgi:hypothetical protein